MLTLVLRGGAEVKALVPTDVRRELRRQAGRAMRAAGVGTAEVCLSLTEDAEMHELNLTYAGEDHATDVLSFSQHQGGATAAQNVLGDVVVSVETAARQAAAQNVLGDVFFSVETAARQVAQNVLGDVVISVETAARQAAQNVLGDVVISVETAARQAAAAGHPLLQELVHLAVHGLCHLLGFDHGTPEEERVMFAYEARLRDEARRLGTVQRVPPG